MCELHELCLPEWLDNHIYNNLDAIYHPEFRDLLVIEWDRNELLKYLGTYFPRSYAEAMNIFCQYITSNYKFRHQESLTVFDFGCGTGGQIIGLLDAIAQHLNNIREIYIFGFDGNREALYLTEDIIEHAQINIPIKIQFKPICHKIDDFYDLDALIERIDMEIDIFMTFKAICEFVDYQQFDDKNPYEHILFSFLPKITQNGIVLLEDITIKNAKTLQWLPELLDKAVNNDKCRIIAKNSGFNQEFKISHSRKSNDISKVAWRLVEKIS